MPVQHMRSSGQAQHAASPEKNQVTSKSPVGDISVVTLIRTDTTLDHSQKAEKVWLSMSRPLSAERPRHDHFGVRDQMSQRLPGHSLVFGITLMHWCHSCFACGRLRGGVSP